MYHQPVHLFVPARSISTGHDVLADMVDAIIMRATSGLSIVAHALEDAGFARKDVAEFHAEAVAIAQTSFWWPSGTFVAIEGL